MSDEQNTMLATSLNPRPHTTRKICEACTQPTLGPLMQCQNGSVLSNWSRWYQKCGHTKCGSFYWHNPPTAIGNIPENVAIRFTLKKSAEEAGPSVGSDEDTTVIRRTFARPLDEGYAKNYISRHRQLLDANAKMEAIQKLKDLTTNSIHVVLWTKVNYPPQHFRLVNSQPGKFVPQEHAIVMAAAELKAAGFIQHLAAVYPSPLWVVHDARVGIPIIGSSSNARILLRKVSLSDDDCLGLNAEISLIPLIPIDEHPHPLGAIAQARRLLALSSSSTPSRNSSPELPSSSKSSPAPPESQEPADDKREMRPLPFPLKNRLSVSALSNAFLAQPSFKNCRFKSQTVYKHLRIYNDAVAADISLSGDTKWADVVKQVEALKTAVTESTALPKTIEVIDNEDEDELGFDVKNLRLEIYRRSGGILETFSPPDSYMDVIVLDQYAPGKRMRVHMAQYMANGNLKTIALKKIFLPGQWFDLWHNKTVATWVEGARLAECGILWQAFASRVRAVDIDLIGVEVLETFSFCQDDNIYFAQSWECGSKFFVNTWSSDLPIDAPNQVAVVEILTAFSHFTYQHHNHRSVFVDFEGFITQEGYRVFDSRTHSLVAMLSYDNEHNDEHGEHADETLQQPFLQSLDAAGIKDFTDTHTCNRVCKALELNSIPLVFPTYKN
ncbi:hypothetical protein C8J57DRAFT_1712536 [Mycena rebaudengoi]|nr:hypothetical protein C8J57DRAFT_1712536 [Mycena rebaudengoi]